MLLSKPALFAMVYKFKFSVHCSTSFYGHCDCKPILYLQLINTIEAVVFLVDGFCASFPPPPPPLSLSLSHSLSPLSLSLSPKPPDVCSTCSCWPGTLLLNSPQSPRPNQYNLHPQNKLKHRQGLQVLSSTWPAVPRPPKSPCFTS